MHTILLYYKYVDIADPESFRIEHTRLCKSLDLTGRIIIAREGLNGTVEGTNENTKKYEKALITDKRFADIHFKRSIGNGKSFPKLSVKVRNEIVSAHLGDKDIDPNKITGTHIAPEKLHELYTNKEDFVVIDMRNDYEYGVGHFKDSINPGMKNFRDLPKVLPKLEQLKNKKVITVCTGGVRCEKASGYLKSQGFQDVYQLHGGMVSYMEKYPNQNFLGSLYVFDGRVTMTFDDISKHTVVGVCRLCNKPAEEYINCGNLNCHDHFICCSACQKDQSDKTSGMAYCDACIVGSGKVQ